MRQIVSVAIKAAITLVVLYFAVGRANFSLVGERIGRLDVAWMLLALAVVAAQLALVTVRWQVIAKRCGAPLALASALRFNLIANFFNQVLPSTVGGDAIRIWLFARAGAGWTKATHSVLLDRFIGILALAMLVVIGLPWGLELIGNPIGRIALSAIGFGSIGAAFAFIGLGMLRWNWLEQWPPTRHLVQMAVTAREILFSARTALPLMALSLLVQALTAAVAWSAAKAVAAPFEFVQAMLLLPPVMLIATIPISIAGWGVREGALVLAFSYAGLAESDGLVISVLLGAAYFGIGLIGGVVWLLNREPLRRAQTLQADEPPPTA
jgi:uncharacterized membrane protein YbhN (UPF0104 family)